jgi:hypothetical protein
VELRDIFQLQDTLVSSVVESLALPLTAGERRLLAHDAPASASAYDLYLRANELIRTREGLSDAIELYEQCVVKDPQYAPAWAHLGRSRWLADKYQAGSAEKIAEADALSGGRWNSIRTFRWRTTSTRTFKWNRTALWMR